jgi:anti-sigma regulatory factor (Ser/Thr protein kinase)
LYAGDEAFVERVTPWLREGVGRREPTLVVVSEAKIALLRAALGRDAREVRFADMREVGRNPARIIPAWDEFIGRGVAAGRSMRGIGEPIWAERTPEELVECARHEALLNLACTGADLWLVCPYDVGTLAPEVLEEAERNHPFVNDRGRRRTSDTYRGLSTIARPFDQPLPEPDAAWQSMTYERDDLRAVRRFVDEHSAAMGLDAHRRADLVLAASEIATNSIRHGGGWGVVRMWRDGDAVVCDFRDSGGIEEPLAGRQRPGSAQTSGYGLWLANQLCDLVQIRTRPSDSNVRLILAIS